MQIVIDIPKEIYIHLLERYKYQNTDDIGLSELDKVGVSIKNGTPLPKGHGRLIDGDELKTLSYEVLIDTDNPNRADGLSVCNGLVEEDIDFAPTIIEADKEVNADEEGSESE